MANRIRKISSVKIELIQKSKEAMLAAVQIFNNPNIQFKSESFIVLAIIAWTYLLHAYYREKKIEYRYFEQKNKRKKFSTTKNRAYKYWELERCLNDANSPVDKITASNLRFLIGLRHEIEHQMTTRIDDLLSARFQACCLNYNQCLKMLFSKQEGIDKFLALSLQFSSLTEKQVDQLNEYKDLPKNILSYIQTFDNNLSDEDFNNSRFSYRVIYIQKMANRKGQADRVYEFISADSEIAKGINKEYVIIKENEKTKYLPSDIWKKMKNEGFIKFGQHQHTSLWKNNNAREKSKGYSILVAKTWYWYESWLNFVRKHCEENATLYT